MREWKVKGESRVRSTLRTRTYATPGTAQLPGKPASSSRSLWGGAPVKARDARGTTFTMGSPPVHPRFQGLPHRSPTPGLFTAVLEESVLFHASRYTPPAERG